MVIREASLLAMKRAVIKTEKVDYVLVDAWKINGLKKPQKAIIKGDMKVCSIAAASVLAKVTRDSIMRRLALQFPCYGFDKHKGYATSFHKEEIKRHGPCVIHRTNWKPFKNNKT